MPDPLPGFRFRLGKVMPSGAVTPSTPDEQGTRKDVTADMSGCIDDLGNARRLPSSPGYPGPEQIDIHDARKPVGPAA